MGEYRISRSATIAAPPERILPLLLSFPEWQRWSPWEGVDPDLQREYSGAESGAGAVYEWRGNKQAGHGIMTITEATGREVAVRVEFITPFKSVMSQVIALEPVDDGTRVTWSGSGRFSWIMSVMTKLFFPMEKTVGGDFERGLAQLKSAVEA